MYTEELIIVMILGVLAYLVVIWANFADFVGILFKILPLKKVPRGYDEMKKVRNNIQFKEHKKRWIRIYLLLIIVYIICYFIVSIYIESYIIGFYAAFILLAICYGIANNIETKQRKEIEKQVRKCEAK